MDLDRCPRCGNAWPGGDKCPFCAFVPIGAGLDKLPKRKRRRARRYVEPGSSRGFLSVVFLGVCGWGAYAYKPWQNDWDLLRALFGQARHHSVVGDWEIEKTLALSKDKNVIVADRGVLQFKPNGQVAFELHNGDAQTTGTGHYEVTGEAVAIKAISTTSEGAAALPPKMSMDLAWTGPDSVIASDGAEALFLRRHTAGKELARLLQMSVKPGQPPAPGEMRGTAATERQPVDNRSDATN